MTATTREAGLPDGRPAFRLIAWLAVPVIGVLAYIGAERFWPADSEPAPIPIELPAPGYGAENYPAALEALDASVARSEARLESAPDEWLRHESYARALLSRSRLIADPADLVLAGEHLSTARNLAPDGAGPMLSSAEWAMAVHELEPAADALDTVDRFAVPPGAAERAEALALRGDLAFYRGDMNGAKAFYDQSEQILAGPGIAVRRSIWLRSQGRFDEAAEAIVLAAGRDEARTPRSVANYALQLAAIDSARGEYDSARGWIEEAESLFPGHWLIDAYKAEAMAVGGNMEGGIELMLSVAERTQDPQVMDAAANLLAEAGREEESARLVERAWTLWAARLDDLAPAYAGHAFENAHVFGRDGLALQLAQRNYEARPHGGSQLLMAEALLALDRAEDAKAQALAALNSGWRSAPLYAVLAGAEEALGNTDAAQQAMAKALELNPRFEEPESGLLWFAHG